LSARRRFIASSATRALVLRKRLGARHCPDRGVLPYGPPTDAPILPFWSWRAGSPWPFRRTPVGHALPLAPAAGRSRRSLPSWLAGRSRAARRPPRPISGAMPGLQACLSACARRPPVRRRPSALGVRPAHAVSMARESPGSGDDQSPEGRRGWGDRPLREDDVALKKEQINRSRNRA